MYRCVSHRFLGFLKNSHACRNQMHYTTSKVISPLRGTRDLFGEDIRKHNFIIQSTLQTARCYGFQMVLMLYNHSSYHYR
jgi:hypothetical protein